MILVATAYLSERSMWISGLPDNLGKTLRWVWVEAKLWGSYRGVEDPCKKAGTKKDQADCFY